MSVAKRELHRLVDSLPTRETRTVKRFIEFVLAQSGPKGPQEDRPFYTLEEVSAVLGLSVRRLRYLIKENVIFAHKERGRWLVKAEDLRELQTPGAREFLRHPLGKDDLTEEEKAASEEGWREHLAGTTIPLSEILKEYQHETRKG